MNTSSQYNDNSTPFEYTNNLEKGDLALRQKNYPEACNYFTQAMKAILTSGSGDLRQFQEINQRLAETYVHAKILNKHHEICTEAFEFLEQSSSTKEILADLYTRILLLGDQQVEINGIEMTESMLEPGLRAVQLWSELKAEFLLVVTQTKYAMFLEAKRPGEGIELLKQVGSKLENLRETGETQEIRKVAASISAGVYGTLANLYFNRNILDEASKYYKLLGSVAESEEEKIQVASSHLSLGHTFLKMGKFKESISEFSEAREIAEDLDDKQSLALIHKGLSLAYLKNKDFENADLELERTSNVLKQLPNGAGVLSMWMDLANNYEKRNIFPRVVECLNSARSVAEGLGNPDALIDVEYKFGLLYYEQGDTKSAIDHFRSAKSTAQQWNRHQSLAVLQKYIENFK